MNKKKLSLVNKTSVKYYVMFIIGLQMICIGLFFYYINACSLNDDIMFNFYERSNTNDHLNIRINNNYNNKSKLSKAKRSVAKTNNYVKLENYRAHLNTNPNQLHFGEINKHSLCGIILKISNLNDNNLQQYYLLCDSMIDCIGFSIHPTIGILFHNHTSFPLQYVRNWNFYIKNTKDNQIYEMKQFTNKRIKYTMNLVSSSIIPSLSSLGLLYSIPIIPRKFMSFEWNLGRTNNQLMSFEAMLQHSVIYLRTLILPFTTHRNHDIGLLQNESLSLWDMMKLSELVDFIFEYEITLNSIPDIKEYVITNNNDINYEKQTFEIQFSSEDSKWKEYFAKQMSRKNQIINEANWNLLSLLEYRMFTNNEEWTLAQESLIQNNWNENEWKCYVSRGSRDAIPHSTLSSCRLIHFCLGRYAHFKLDDWPIFDVLHFMIPSPRIRAAVDNTIQFWFEQPKYYRIGVHRRAMKEGGKDGAGSPYVCRFRSKSLTHSGQYQGLKRHIQHAIQNEFGNKLSNTEMDIKIQSITDLYDRTCATDFHSVQQILRFHKQKPLVEQIFWDNSIKRYEKRSQQMEPWFLACDNQEPDILNEFIEKYGAITGNGKSLEDFWNGPLYWNLAADMEIEQQMYAEIVEKQYLKYLKIFQNEEELRREHTNWLSIINDGHQPRWWYEMSKIEFWRKEIVVFDMWMLKNAQFFVGSWHSTLTRNVCHWRGYHNMYNSTNCYLVHKWRAVYDKKLNNHWFDINAVQKPELIWKNGK